MDTERNLRAVRAVKNTIETKNANWKTSISDDYFDTSKVKIGQEIREEWGYQKQSHVLYI